MKVDILHGEFDAKKWASEFIKICPEIDEEFMSIWFSNAIMSGYDFCYSKYKVGKLEKVVEAARHIHWQCTQQRMENLHMALKELDGEK